MSNYELVISLPLVMQYTTHTRARAHTHTQKACFTEHDSQQTISTNYQLPNLWFIGIDPKYNMICFTFGSIVISSELIFT